MMQSRAAAEHVHTTDFIDKTRATAQRELPGAVYQGPRAAAQRALIDSINTSPRVLAQRQRLGALFGTRTNTPLQGVFLEKGEKIKLARAKELATGAGIVLEGEVLARLKSLSLKRKEEKDIAAWISEELASSGSSKKRKTLARTESTTDPREKQTKVPRVAPETDEVVAEELPKEAEVQVPAEEEFAFPEELYAKISTLPTEKSVSGSTYYYQYDEHKMLALQPLKGREMRQKEELIKSGAWHGEKSREQFRLTVTGGVLIDADKQPVDGRVQYVMSEGWGLYGRTKIPERKAGVHTALLAGDPVRAAGWIGARSGKVFRIGNDSGHYGPVPEQLYQLIWLLEKGGVDMSEVEVQDAEAGMAYLGNTYKTWLATGAREQDRPQGKKSANW